MSSTNRTGFGPGAGLGVVTVVCGAIIAISPTWTWFRGTALRRGAWSGFGLYADRDGLSLDGTALMMAFDAAGWYDALFGPAVPTIAGLVLVIGGLTVGLRRTTVTPAWSAWGAALALWSLGAAGLSGKAGVHPAGDIGGAGVRAWAIASAVGAAWLAREVGRRWSRALTPSSSHRLIDWISVPAILLGGVFAALLAAAEQRHPFAAEHVFVAASLTVAFPAAGTIAALVSVAPPQRSLPVMVVNTSALVLGVVLFALWTQLAVE